MKTIISAGLAISEILQGNAELSAAVRGKIFPVMTDEADAPYICYNMAGVEQGKVKGFAGPWAAQYEVAVYAKTYSAATSIAEQVCATLNGFSGTAAGLVIRDCQITNCVDGYDADAYVKVLTLSIKV